MGNSSTAAKNRYNRKAYDRVNITFPKGKKEIVANFAKSRGMSLNKYINDLIDKDMNKNSNENVPL